ncbi:hypothetical protein B4110_3353 [Parageobacillus toebii]|uniref:Uncharacterized protein n=1 Tax=Parageobacillus toebii TaxID=153151 RepID=A0A150N4P4_9BACL|nr:hypothetical protein B4110_3353 [Parageobacillus toebii]
MTICAYMAVRSFFRWMEKPAPIDDTLVYEKIRMRVLQ